VPANVEREFRRYLECGFARARCRDCGHDFLVALSCQRGEALYNSMSGLLKSPDTSCREVSDRKWPGSVPSGAGSFAPRGGAAGLASIRG
jgi:hypothetical protein